MWCSLNGNSCTVANALILRPYLPSASGTVPTKLVNKSLLTVECIPGWCCQWLSNKCPPNINTGRLERTGHQHFIAWSQRIEDTIVVNTWILLVSVSKLTWKLAMGLSHDFASSSK